MKSIKYMFMAIAAFAAMSCIQEENPVTDSNKNIKLVPMTFTASIDKGADTKVMYDGAKTKWETTDKIMVVSSDGSVNEFEIVSLENDGTTAVFSGESSENATEYYAVYPSSAYKGDGTEALGKDGKLYVEVKATQQAIAGTFDPSAALAIARSDADGNIVFKHSCAYLKFQLADAADVKKVHLSINNSDNVAGIGYVGVSASDLNTQFATTDDKLSKYNMITLLAPEDGFVAGEDYFIAMRANSCPKGLTMYIEYEDCVKSRTSTNQVFVAEGDKSGSIGKIKNLGQLDKNLTTLTPYEAYNFGADIMVAGKAINKATYGEATLITAESTDGNINKAGIYFVNADANGITLGAGTNNQSVIVIGNTYNERSKVSREKYIPLPSTENDDYWIMSNISFNITNTSGYTFRANTSNTLELFAFDNCAVNIPTGQQFIYIAGTDEVKNIYIYNSDFLVSAEATNNFIKADKAATIDNITIDNNVFYTANPEAPAKAFALIAETNATVTNLIINQNTLYGAMGTIYTSSPKQGTPLTFISSVNCTITNNMFVVQENSGGNVALVNKAITSSMNITNNRCWINNNKSYRIGGIAGSFQAPSGTAEQPGSRTPTNGNWDPSQGHLLLDGVYGATR